MTDKEKAKELASLLVGEDQNPQPLIDVLLDMAKWKETQVKESAKTQHVDKTCKEKDNSLTQEPECMFTKDNYTDEDRKVLCKNCEEKCEYSEKEELVSKDLEEAIKEASEKERLHKAKSGSPFFMPTDFASGFKAGAKWLKANLWKDAQGDDLPEIDREVIALLNNGKVVFAHRPLEFWDGKNIDTGKVTRYYPKTYDKGGWNIPNVKYWADMKVVSRK